jgi:hypothetical protein
METPDRIIVERLLQERRGQAAAERLARLSAAPHRAVRAPARSGTARAQPRASVEAICCDAVCGDARAAGEVA